MKIRITSNFHYGRHKFLTPGDYRVPNHISKAIADQAVKAGVAAWVAPRPPDDVVERMERTGKDIWIADTEKTGRNRRSRKGPAPENKSRGSAPDNKAAVE